MDDCVLRELAAAYALGALDPGERERYEAHLASCRVCTADVEALRDPILVLARSLEPAEPAAALRDRVLAAVTADAAPQGARHEPAVRRALVAARRRRPLVAGLALAAAAVVAAVAIALVRGPAPRTAEALLGEPVATHAALGVASGTGNAGRVLVGADGRAVAEVTLPPAPAGKVYEAWVMPGGHARLARGAGLFHGGGTQTVVLTRRARNGDVVGITLEPAGGSPTPTSAPVAIAHV